MNVMIIFAFLLFANNMSFLLFQCEVSFHLHHEKIATLFLTFTNHFSREKKNKRERKKDFHQPGIYARLHV